MPARLAEPGAGDSSPAATLSRHGRRSRRPVRAPRPPPQRSAHRSESEPVNFSPRIRWSPALPAQWAPLHAPAPAAPAAPSPPRPVASSLPAGRIHVSQGNPGMAPAHAWRFSGRCAGSARPGLPCLPLRARPATLLVHASKQRPNPNLNAATTALPPSLPLSLSQTPEESEKFVLCFH